MIFGRDQELQILTAHYEKMLEGNGSVLFLTGEAGLGKTTLVHTWRDEGRVIRDEGNQKKSLVPHPSTLFLESACSIPIGNVDVGSMEALQPWVDVIARLQTIANRTFDLNGLFDASAPVWKWALSNDSGTTGGERSGNFEHNAKAANQQQVFQQYVNLLLKISADVPLVIFLDDVHWADASSISLLRYLSRQITDKKVLIIAAYRPEETSAGNGVTGHPLINAKNEILRNNAGIEVALNCFNNKTIRQLLDCTFSAYVVDGKLEQWLQTISGGNALFVSQFIKTLREDGLVNEHGRFTGNYETVAIPHSTRSLVMQRLHRLDKETREVLGYATAEGDDFSVYVLEQLTKKDIVVLSMELRKAEKAGVIREKGLGRFYANQFTVFFGFSHTLFRKVLYDLLSGTQREFLHRRCYELLREVWEHLPSTNDRVTPLASKLLTHAEKCSEDEFAAEVALAAAHASWEAYSEVEALEMIEHVRRLSAKVGVSAANQNELRLGEAALLRAIIDEHRGRYEDALNAASEAYEFFHKIGNRAKCASALNKRAWIGKLQGAFDASEVEARKAFALAEQCSAPKEKAIALSIIGVVYLNRGEYDDALEYLKASVEIHEAISHRTGIATVLNNIGAVYKDLGAYDEALEYYGRSIEMYESSGNRAGLASSLNNVGIVKSVRGENDEALEYHYKSLQIREGIGDRAGMASSLGNLGTIYEELGAYDKALEQYERSLEVWEVVDDRRGIAYTLNNIGCIYDYLGSYDKALEYFNKSLSIKEAIGHVPSVATTLNNIGSVHKSLGEYKEALDYYKRSLELKRSLRNLVGQATTLSNMGNCYLSLDLYEEALGVLNESAAISDQVGQNESQASTFNSLGNVHLRRGDYEKAIPFLEKALHIADATKQKHERYDALRKLGETYRKFGEFRKSGDCLKSALVLAHEMQLQKEETEVLDELELLAQEEASQIIIRPKTNRLESDDAAFLRRVLSAINTKMNDEKFGVEALAGLMGMSRVHLHRKLTALTEQSAGNLIRSIRLERAMQLLKKNAANVSEAAYAVGFGNPSYFAQCFRDKFGVAPSEISRQAK